MFDERRKGTEVTRQALYDQIWSTPMTKLAKEYGISDVALAKICKKLSVPYRRAGIGDERRLGKRSNKCRFRQIMIQLSR